jgi:hypothetical protein
VQHTTFKEFHAALCAKVKERIPELKSVEAYSRVEAHAKVPFAMVEVTDITPDDNGDIGTEQYAARVAFSIYLLGDSRNEPEAKLAIRALAARVSARMRGQHLGVAGGTVEIRGAYADFIAASGYNANGANAARFFEVWRVDASVVIYLEEDCWNWPEHDVEFVFAEGVPVPPVDVL